MVIEGGGVRLKAVGHGGGLGAAGGEQLQLEQGGAHVIQAQMEGAGAVLVVAHVRLDLGLAADGVVHPDQILVAVHPHGIGQAALADLAVPAALFRDGIALLLVPFQLARLHHVAHGLGEGEIVHALVAQGQLQQLEEGDRPGHPGHDIKHQQFQV